MTAPHRLLQLRYLDGLTAEEAAAGFDIAGSTYSAIERGTRSFTLDPSLIGYSVERIRSLPNMSEAMHRQRASVGERIIRSNKEQLRVAGELMLELRELVPKCPRISLTPIQPPRSLEDVEEAAMDARYMLGVGLDEPIMNLTSTLERAGVCLTPVADDPIGLSKSPKRVDGLSAWVAGEQPVIGVNPDAPGDRFRLTLAHEVGHLLMHQRPNDSTEDEAFLFASALLVPTERFDDAVPNRPTMKHFEALKSMWGISIAAGIYRAHQLGKLDDDRYRSLQMQMAKWRHKEPGSFDARPGRLLPKLIESCGGPTVVAARLGIAKRHINRTISWEQKPRLVAHAGGGQSRSASRAQLSPVEQLDNLRRPVRR